MAQSEVQGAACAVVNGDYDYDYVDPPPDRLVCSHVYCQACLYKVKTIPGREYLCPMCRSANFKTISHHEADRTIKELKVYCPHKTEIRAGHIMCLGWGTGDVNRHLERM